MVEDERGETGVDGVALPGLDDGGGCDQFGQQPVGSVQDRGESSADTGGGLGHCQGVGIQQGCVEPCRSQSPAFPVQDGQWSTGEVGPVQVAVGTAPTAHRGVKAEPDKKDGRAWAVVSR